MPPILNRPRHSLFQRPDTMTPYTLEICANSVESALAAQEAGAHRVELCAAMPEGGTTPSRGTIRLSRERLHATRLHVIIRPRGGDFLYNELEREVILDDIRCAREEGADGVVVGALQSEGDIDTAFMQQVMAEARGLSVTFHRAFDMCRDPRRALEELVALGVDRILTSGQEATAEAGIPLLRELTEAARDRIIIMPGCGINAQNITRIARETGAREFHLSGRRTLPSAMRHRNPRVSMGGTVRIEEYGREATDPAKVRAALAALAAL